MEKRIVINSNTAKEITRIFDMYIQRFGNITISELISKFDTDFLILN